MRRYRYGDVDLSQVDHLAVGFACNGTPMDLNRDEVTVAAKRMVGKCSSIEIARRCRSHERTIIRILNGLGAQQCPHCQQLILLEDGIAPKHIDYWWGDLCPQSEHPVEQRQHQAVS